MSSSNGPSYLSDSEGGRRCSVDSNSSHCTSTTDFLAAVATEPPREEDWKGYPSKEVVWSNSPPRTPNESDEFPAPERLAEAAKTAVCDADGYEISFGSLCKGRRGPGKRRLVLFIRHWYCRACQDYTRSLQELIPSDTASQRSEDLNPPSIVLVGCGDPALIKPYIRRTGCPYPIYTDPSLKLFKLLGCHRWGGMLWGFSKRPGYVRDPSATGLGIKSMLDKYRSIYTESMSSDEASDFDLRSSSSSQRQPVIESGLKKRVSMEGLRSGPIFQVGGEFLFENGKLVWCHRMKGIRSHAEISTLRRVLDIDEGEQATIEQRLDSKWLEQELKEKAQQSRKHLRKKPSPSSLACMNTRAPNQQLVAAIASKEDEMRYLEQQKAKIRAFQQLVVEPDIAKAFAKNTESLDRRKGRPFSASKRS